MPWKQVTIIVVNRMYMYCPANISLRCRSHTLAIGLYITITTLYI